MRLELRLSPGLARLRVGRLAAPGGGCRRWSALRVCPSGRCGLAWIGWKPEASSRCATRTLLRRGSSGRPGVLRGLDLNLALVRDDRDGLAKAEPERHLPARQPLLSDRLRRVRGDHLDGVQLARPRGAVVAPEPYVEPSPEPSAARAGRVRWRSVLLARSVRIRRRVLRRARPGLVADGAAGQAGLSPGGRSDGISYATYESAATGTVLESTITYPPGSDIVTPQDPHGSRTVVDATVYLGVTWANTVPADPYGSG